MPQALRSLRFFDENPTDILTNPNKKFIIYMIILFSEVVQNEGSYYRYG